MKEFSFSTRIFFGEGSLERLYKVHNKRVMIVTDAFMEKSGVAHRVAAYLKDCEVTIFSDVVPDPPIEVVAAGVECFQQCMPEVMIAVGGGSVIDAAKAIRVVAGRIVGDIDAQVKECFAIPTTSGTGSEVTEVSVITDPEKKTKYPLVSEELIADVAILDAELVKTVPKTITADTGMDIITHAIEAFVSTGNSEFSDALAERAIKLCCRYLCRSYLNPNDMEARGKIHVASCMAGMAFNQAGLGLNHGMAHQLGARFHIPHGRANAMLLPCIISYNSDITNMTIPHENLPACVKKYCEIAASLGIVNFNEVSTVRSFMNYIKILTREMDMPCCIKDVGGITKEEYFPRCQLCNIGYRKTRGFY